MKIYTKKGDKGKTSLIGGKKVSKSHIRIEAYGTVDELNACLGVLSCQAIFSEKKHLLQQIQSYLFTIGSHLASDSEKTFMQLPVLQETYTEQLERDIDEMEETLPPLTHFVLPGGHAANSDAHLARCVCRRAERCVVLLNEEESVSPLILSYLNRLSDWLFVLARLASHLSKTEEIKWMPS